MRTFEISGLFALCTALVLVALLLITTYLFIGRAQAQSQARAYKIYLDALIGMDLALESMKGKAYALYMALSEALTVFPYPNEADLGVAKDSLENLEAILNRSISDVWVRDLIGQMDRLYALQAGYHVTSAISTLRRDFEVCVARYNTYIDRMLSVEKRLGQLAIPVKVSERIF